MEKKYIIYINQTGTDAPSGWFCGLQYIRKYHPFHNTWDKIVSTSAYPEGAIEIPDFQVRIFTRQFNSLGIGYSIFEKKDNKEVEDEIAKSSRSERSNTDEEENHT